MQGKTLVLSAVRQKKIQLTNAKPMGQGIQVLGEEKIPTLSEEQYLDCRNDHEKLRTILAEKSITPPSIRKVVAIIQEKGSHISGYRLDDMKKEKSSIFTEGKSKSLGQDFKDINMKMLSLGKMVPFKSSTRGIYLTKKEFRPNCRKHVMTKTVSG